MHEFDAARASAPPIFAGGVPRSGLTLLRALLNAHPSIACGPDTGLTPGLPMQWRDMAHTLGDLHKTEFFLTRQKTARNFAQVIDTVLANRAAGSGKHRAAEKNPLNILALEALGELFPLAKFIHVVRDGRDVVASLLSRYWINPATGAQFAHVTDPVAAAQYWSQLAAFGLAAENSLGPRIFRLTYENLTLAPEQTCQQLCAFLEEPYAPDMLQFYKTPIALHGIEADSRERLLKPLTADTVGRWRNELTSTDIEAIRPICENTLLALGY